MGVGVTPGLDALLAALHVFIDDHVAPRRRIGRPPKLTDAEMLCLAVAQVLLGFPSARHWIRFAHARLGRLFRYLPREGMHAYTPVPAPGHRAAAPFDTADGGALRAPAGWWWARIEVESTETSPSIPPAASAWACACWSSRSQVPSADQRRWRSWTVFHGP